MQVQDLFFAIDKSNITDMKKLYLYICLVICLSSGYLQAQHVSPKILATAGGSVSVGNLRVSRTIGETFIKTSPTNTTSVSRGFQQNTSTITVGTINPVTFCSGNNLTIPFTATDIFGNGNIFTAQLSDVNGSFSSPVTLGTLAGNSSGNIQGIIPLNTNTGNGYRIRVISSSPGVNSLPNASNLVINQIPQAQASNTGPYVVGQTIALNASGGTSYNWSGPDSFSSVLQAPNIANATQAKGGIYTVTVTQSNCSATATTNVIVIDTCERKVDYYYDMAGNPYQALFLLTDGMSINQIPEQTTISLVPSCDGLFIGSFEMNIQGPDLNWNIIDNDSPYTLFGNSGNHFYGRNLLPGEYTLTATGYAEDNKGGGITYGPVITRFTIADNLATISMPTLSTTNLCAGSSLNVSFTTTGSFQPGTTFQVQLSNANGTFESPQPTVIGTTDVAGTVSCTIPLNVAFGTEYRIRVIASGPVLAGNPTNIFLTINPLNRTITSAITSGDIILKASGEITGSNLVISPAKVAYQAARVVTLIPGFETQGAIFKAEIKACTD
jgi:hypothetical protein